MNRPAKAGRGKSVTKTAKSGSDRSVYRIAGSGKFETTAKKPRNTTTPLSASSVSPVQQRPTEIPDLSDPNTYKKLLAEAEEELREDRRAAGKLVLRSLFGR
jgi:hypothetical protein